MHQTWIKRVFSTQLTERTSTTMDLLPDTKMCASRMRRKYRERYPHHWLQRKPLVRDPGMHHSTCVTHVPWCMSGSLTRGGGEKFSAFPAHSQTCRFTYLARVPCQSDPAHLLFTLCSYFFGPSLKQTQRYCLILCHNSDMCGIA